MVRPSLPIRAATFAPTETRRRATLTMPTHSMPLTSAISPTLLHVQLGMVEAKRLD